jgi:hypothetical protein
MLDLGACRSAAAGLDIELGDDSTDPSGQPPRAAAKEGEDGGHERHADDEGIDRDTEREAKGDGQSSLAP